MNDTTTSTPDAAQAEVQSYGIGIPQVGPGMPPVGFELETVGSPTGRFGPIVAPGHPVGAPAVPLAMRTSGGQGAVQGYGIVVPQAPTVAAPVQSPPIDVPGQPGGVLRCWKAGGLALGDAPRAKALARAQAEIDGLSPLRAAA